MRQTTTIDIEELSLPLANEQMARHESLTACAFPAKVEFDYAPALPAKLSGPMEDAEEGSPAQLEIRSVKLVRATNFTAVNFNLWVAKGTEMIEFFSARQLDKMEENLIAKQGESNV